MTTPEDQKQIISIKTLIKENDKSARLINDLFRQKEELENAIYIESTKNKVSDILDSDVQNINEKIALIKKEDRDIMEQLNISDKALEKKDKTIIELDQKIAGLRDHLASAENDIDSKRQSIKSLKVQI